MWIIYAYDTVFIGDSPEACFRQADQHQRENGYMDEPLVCNPVVEDRYVNG